PPPDSGRLSSNPPGMHAGNLDNKYLVAGTTLFIPVFAPGALFEIGDGHVAQGDGEVDQTAIETSLEGRLQFIVRKDLHYTWPHAETPTYYITMGTDKDLTQATKVAVQEMVDWLSSTRGLPKMEAYRLASIAADLHITELVDGNGGVHMMIPKSIFKKHRARASGRCDWLGERERDPSPSRPAPGARRRPRTRAGRPPRADTTRPGPRRVTRALVSTMPLVRGDALDGHAGAGLPGRRIPITRVWQRQRQAARHLDH